MKRKFMDDLTRLPFDDFLNRVAERTPAPGGGSVTAATGALACSLARMVIAYSIGKNTEPNVRATLDQALVDIKSLDDLMRSLITRDAAAYEEIASASKTLKIENTASAKDSYQKAVLAGLAVPMEIAAIASRLLAKLDEIRETLNPRLLSDLGVLATLAESSAKGASYMVDANLSEIGDPAVRAKARSEIIAILNHCAESHRAIESFVRAALERL